MLVKPKRLQKSPGKRIWPKSIYYALKLQLFEKLFQSITLYFRTLHTIFMEFPPICSIPIASKNFELQILPKPKLPSKCCWAKRKSKLTQHALIIFLSLPLSLLLCVCVWNVYVYLCMSLLLAYSLSSSRSLSRPFFSANVYVMKSKNATCVICVVYLCVGTKPKSKHSWS